MAMAMVRVSTTSAVVVVVTGTASCPFTNTSATASAGIATPIDTGAFASDSGSCAVTNPRQNRGGSEAVSPSASTTKGENVVDTKPTNASEPAARTSNGENAEDAEPIMPNVF